MPVKTYLAEEDIADLCAAAAHGAPVARLCREFGIGRARCERIIAEARGAEEVAAAMDAERAADLAGSGAASAGRPPRVTEHYMADEPPEPEVVSMSVPVLTPPPKSEKTAPSAKSTAKADVSQSVTVDAAVADLNKAQASVATGSDDSKIVDKGLAALKVVEASGAVPKAKAQQIRRDLTTARHGHASKQAASAASDQLSVEPGPSNSGAGPRDFSDAPGASYRQRLLMTLRR
jgi:hypothetical protein